MNTSRSFKILAALMALAGASAVTALLWHFADRRAHSPSTTAEEAGLSGSGHGRSGCTFFPGQELSYQVAETTDLRLDPARLNLPPGAQLSGMPPSRSIEVTMDLKALPSDGRPGAILLGRYSKVDEKTAADAGVITAPFLVRVDSSCKLVGFARQDTTADKIARTQQAIAIELQWRWPRDGQVEDNGENTLGRFRARYQSSEIDGKTSVRRRILAFTELRSGSKLPGSSAQSGVMAPRESEMTIEPGPGPWFTTLTGHEDFAGIALVDVKSTVAARQVPTAPGAFDGLPTDLARYVWVDLFGSEAKVASDRRHSREELELMERLRGLPLKEVLALYKDKLDHKENIARRWPMLELYLEAHPELIKTVAKMLRNNELEDYLEPDLYLALGKVPGPQARDALMDINADKSAMPADRTRAAFAIIDRDDVGADFARTLQGDAQAMNSGGSYDQRAYGREALLALSTMSGLRDKEIPEIKSMARQVTADLLKQGKDEIALAPVFGAISNIGDPALLDSVEPFTRSPDPGVRSEATSALRRMPASQTVSFSVDWLQRENSVRVRESLYVSIVQQLAGGKVADPALVAQAIADLGRGPNAATRQAIYKIIGPVAKTNPAAKAALIAQVKHEQDAQEGLSSLLGEYLTSVEIQQGLQMP